MSCAGGLDETAADLALLGRVLNEWDLYSLIRTGAPEDEFDSGRRRICEVLKPGEADSEASLAEFILTLFTEMFGDVFTLEECSAVPHKIWPWWEAKQKK